jgi:polysaccharide export outer membrane protein
LVLSGLQVTRVWAQQPTDKKPTEQQNGAAADLPAKTIPDAAISASGAGSNSDKADASKESAGSPNYVTLGPGDLIEVSVYNVPELTSKVRVSNSGDIYLPLIDYVHVEGLTQEEAQTLIEKRLADGGFVRNPHATIFVDEFTSQGVTIIGEVGRPGVYPNIGDHKLYEVVSQAGGFSQNASRKITIIRRNQEEPIRVSLPRNLGDDLSGNIPIQAGDTITVPRAPIIYVVGDVGRPSGILADNGTMTVPQALALAGGTNRTAKLGGTRILRKGPDGGVTETKVEIKKLLEAKAPDVPLQPDDILFVPLSRGRIMVARTFDAAMSVATAMALYTIRP